MQGNGKPVVGLPDHVIAALLLCLVRRCAGNMATITKAELDAIDGIDTERFRTVMSETTNCVRLWLEPKAK